MPTQREIQIAEYLALQERSGDVPVAVGEEAEILSRIIDNNLERIDKADKLPIDPLYEGADTFKMVVTAEFVLPALGSQATIKTYRANHGYGGGRPPISEIEAFNRAVADISNQIISDPPYLYIDAGLEAIRRGQQAERNARESRGEVDSRVLILGLTNEQVLERLVTIRERVIRDNPFTSDSSREARGDLLFGNSISPNRAVLNERLRAELEAIRVSLGEVVIRRVIFDARVDGQLKTQIAYNFETGDEDLGGPRYITGPPISGQLRSRYEELTSILYDGDLPVEAEEESIEELRAKVRESERFNSEFDYFNIAIRLLEEAENVRSVLLQNLGVSEEEIDFSTVNENFDMLEAGTNDIFGLLEGPEGVARYASLIRPDSPLIVDAGGFEPDRVARLRSFISKIKGFIFEIRKLDVDAQINAQRNLEELLASEEKSRILDTRSFIILDSKNRSLEFRIPIEFNEKSIQVLAIKRYLGLPLSSGDLFDAETKKELQSFQDLNINRFRELVEEDLGNAAAGQDILELIPEEYGSVGPYTFLTMKLAGGLERAVEDVLDYARGIAPEVTGTDEDSLKTLARERARDGYRPPWKDANYYYFMYVTEETRDSVNADIPGSYERMIAQNGEIALRRGVEELFEFHARSKTWDVEGKISEHKVFNRLLKYQNKIEDKMSKNQRFTLTIQQQTLAENLGVSDAPRVDVLFGQSLKVGAKPIFASLEEIHSPTERPNSKFKITIKIRRELMDAIPTDPSRTATIGQAIAAARRVSNAVRDVINNRDEIARRFGDSARERQAQVEGAILDKAKSVNDGLQWAQNNKKEAIEKGVKGAFGLAKKFSRDAALAKQFGNTTIASELSRKQEAALIAQVMDYHRGEHVKPITSNYTLYGFNTMIDNVAAMFDRFAKDFEDFGKEGGRIRPAINLREEAKHLREIKPAMTSFLSANGIVKRDFLREDVQIKITFVESLMERKFLPPKDPETNFQPPEVVIEDKAGLLPIAISYIEPGKRARRLQQATLVLAQKYPWNIPRTMAYLSSLVELNEEANDYDASCLQVNLFSEELTYSEKDPIGLMQTYTYPHLFVLPGPEFPSGIRTDKAEAKLARAFGSIKTSLQKVQEDLSIEGDGPVANAFRRDIIRLEQSKTYPIVPEIPTVELCSLESLFDEFLDKFDLKTLFCNYAACIPDLPWPPSFSWDLDFTIPEIPRLPSFDPMAIIIPRLELAILDLILGFLCGLVRGILDLIRFPDCEDIANFGKAAWDELWDNSRGPSKRLLVMQDAAKVMDDLDIPSAAFPDVSSLFDQLANILTPAELCSLLDGTADAETLTIVLELVQTSFPDLERHFRNEADISMFFMLLGKFVDPELCNRISNTSNIIIGDIFCPDRPMTTLRRRMQENRATSEEIAKAMTDATKRREAFKELFAKDPMADLVPNPGNGIPGPYDNEVSRELAKMSAETTMNVVEMSIKNDMISFIPSLFDTEQSQKGPTDSGFNPVEEAEYRFLQGQINRIAGPVASEVTVHLRYIETLDERYMEYWNLRKDVRGGVALNDNNRAKADIDFGEVIFGTSSEDDDPITREDLDAGDLRIGADGRLELHSDAQANTSVLEDVVIRMGFPEYDIRVLDLRTGEVTIIVNTENLGRIGEDLGAWDDRPIGGDQMADRRVHARGTLEQAQERANRLKAVLEQIVLSRARDRIRLMKPGQLVDNGNGTFDCLPAVREDGEDKEHIFYDLMLNGDITEMMHILGFPMRNTKDTATVAPFVSEVLSSAKMRTNVEKRFTSPYDFYNEEARYMDLEQLTNPRNANTTLRISDNPPEDRHFFIGLESEKVRSQGEVIEGELVSEKSPFKPKVLYQEIPIKSDKLHDCYNLYYPSRLLTLIDDSLIWRGITYNQEIPEYALAKRSRVRDLEQEQGYTLLRPAAFAELFLNSWQKVGEDTPSQNISGYNNELWKKLAGNMSNADERVRGEYENIVENFIDDLSNQIVTSRFFDLGAVRNLSRELTEQFELSSDGTCYIEREPFIDFEKLRDSVVESYQDSLSQEEYNPLNRDFTKPGPLEDSISGQLVILYAKTFLIEFALKGLFVFSRYAPGKIFEQEAVKDYVKNYMIASIDADLSKDIAGLFADEVRKIGNDSELGQAIKNIVESMSNDFDFIDSIERVFKPDFRSYKDQFITDLFRNAKQVQSFFDIVPPSRRQRNIEYQNGDSRIVGPKSESRRGFVPMHDSFGGQVQSSNAGLEKLRRGHFFVESYFIIDPGLYKNYFDSEDSLIRRIIEEAKTVDRGGREEVTFYDHRQYSGVFNTKELGLLISELIAFKELPQAKLSEEIEEMIRDFDRPGSLKLGYRLVYTPATSGAGQVVGPSIETMIVPGTEGFQVPLMQTIEGYNYNYDADALSRAIGDRDILAESIIDTIGEDYSSMLLEGGNPPDLDNIPQVEDTIKHRAYVADTNPKLNSRGPADSASDVSFLVADGGAILLPGEGEGPGLNVGVTWRETQSDVTATDQLRAKVAVGVGYVEAGTDADNNGRNDAGTTPRKAYPGLPQNVIFPTPLASQETSVCFSDLIDEYVGGGYVQFNRSLNDKRAELQRSFAGIETGRDLQLRLTGEMSNDMKYIFEFLFPLERYQTMFLIQNEILMDKSPAVATLMSPTRNIINSLVEEMKDPVKLKRKPNMNGKDIYSVLVSDQTSAGPGPMAKYKLGGFGPMIEKLALRTVPTLIRGQAAFLDPAYKDIKKVFDNEPCKTRGGLTLGTLGAPFVLSKNALVGDFLDNPTLKGGFDERDRSYHPFNVQGLIDLNVIMKFMAYAPIPANFAYFPALLNIIEHMSNGVTGGDPRYGKFLSPVGLLALGMPQLPGENHAAKVREAKCDEDNNRTTPKGFVLCDDVNQEEEE